MEWERVDEYGLVAGMQDEQKEMKINIKYKPAYHSLIIIGINEDRIILHHLHGIVANFLGQPALRQLQYL